MGGGAGLQILISIETYITCDSAHGLTQLNLCTNELRVRGAFYIYSLRQYSYHLLYNY